MRRQCRGRSAVALLTALGLALPVPTVSGQQAQAPTTKAPTTQTPPKTSVPGQAPATAAPASTAPAAQPSAPRQAAPAATVGEPDGGWPRAYTTPSGGRLLLYQPQIASWDGQKRMVAYSAVSYEVKGAQKPALGTLQIESNTTVSVPERLVKFSPIQVKEAKFSTLDRDQTREVVSTISDGIPDNERVIALDRVLAHLEGSQILPKNVEGVKADPPAIFFSSKPAVLVNFDGEPIWSPIKDNNLKYAINTNWDIFQDEPTKKLYLRNEGSWLQAADVKGPWTPAGTLPDSFKKLPADENWKDVKAALPGKKLDAKSVPTVFVSMTPAEMLLLRGEPSYLLVSGTKDLLWVQNTDSDLFRMGKTGPVYYLVAGRWFSAPAFTGPWAFATPKLPEDFKRIPLEHPRSRVLASVPGTAQAAEAVLLAQVPQTARVNRKELKAPEVTYQGDPKFESIPQTSVARAVNTDKDIIKVGDLYYMCTQGVWFVAKSAQGPWEVAKTVPESIYQIPASSPSHNVTYVTVVEDDDNDDWVTFAAVAGYTGMMTAWGCAVWGTGYYYPPYWGYGGYYPYYYPFYPTYGYGAYYNPWTGAYGRSAVAYGPYGGAGVTARYNPRTGTYSRGAAAWGPYGARGVAEAYNPRTGTYGRTRQGSNVYGSWGSTAVQRGDDWARTSRVTNNRTGNTTRVTQGSGGGEAISRRGGPAGGGTVARTGSGDIYAGRDGNVYRKNGDTWQRYDGGSWGNVDSGNRQAAGERAGTSATPRTSTAGTTGAGSAGGTVSQLDRDRAARADGATRTHDAGTYRSGGGSTTRSGSGSYGGSYRPSGGARGGGMRGGGRR
jgi:hypothetical protein